MLSAILRASKARTISRAPRAAAVAALPLIAATLAVAPQGRAVAATCQAINSSSILSGSIPGPACTGFVNVGDTFEIDLSNVFASNPSDFSLSNSYSLQIANINQFPAGSTLDFANVEFLVTGAFGSTTFSTPTAISVWQATGQTGQGISNYSTNGTGTNFGFGTAFNSANFRLTAPQSPGTFGTAGVINTIAFNLAAAGVSSFTGAKIRGQLVGASSAATDFSAGLAIFSTNNQANQPPNLIYGNAFNTVPGPLPLVGAGVAFGWSRRLRRRVAAANAV